MSPPRDANATSAFARFFAHESAGGLCLGAAALLALVVSNTALAPAYEAFLRMPGSVSVGGWLSFEKPLLVWVNDLWMAVFFFLVGLEIKREFVEGELASPRQAMLPAAAALGGMVVPAAIYAALNWGDAQALRGWAIPSATDIAVRIVVDGEQNFTRVVLLPTHINHTVFTVNGSIELAIALRGRRRR